MDEDVSSFWKNSPAFHDFARVAEITEKMWSEHYVFDAFLWVDPGEMTGWAIYVNPFPPGAPLVDYLKAEESRFLSGQLPRFQFGQFLPRAIKLMRGNVKVGFEQYLVAPGSHVNQDWSALKTIGVIEQVVHDFGLTAASFPSSSRLAGLKALDAAGWKSKHFAHGNDAAAHLLTYLLYTNQAPPDVRDKVEIALMGMPWQFSS
jgi:hypothetical protein